MCSHGLLYGACSRDAGHEVHRCLEQLCLRDLTTQAMGEQLLQLGTTTQCDPAEYEHGKGVNPPPLNTPTDDIKSAQDDVDNYQEQHFEHDCQGACWITPNKQLRHIANSQLQHSQSFINYNNHHMQFKIGQEPYNEQCDVVYRHAWLISEDAGSNALSNARLGISAGHPRLAGTRTIMKFVDYHHKEPNTQQACPQIRTGSLEPA